MISLGLYIHIPFCPYRCHYCDFAIVTGRQHAIPDYVKAVRRDLEKDSKKFENYKIKSVYFGGGTPSLLDPKHYEDIFSSISSFYNLKNNIEISLESNPETLSPHKLSGYLKAGINRLSLGVQAMQDRHLRKMGRFHDSARCAQAFQAARGAGFTNLSVDLLFGLPGQTLEEWRASLQAILSWKPEHISAYGLQVEPTTKFWKDAQIGNLPVPNEDTQAEMYESLLTACKKSGIHQYEISNFAKPGFECQHNLIYWNNEEYLGIGLGAVSYIEGKRFWMTRNFKTYLSGEETVVGSEILPPRAQLGETLMLGLRLRGGISTENIRRRFGHSPDTIYATEISRFRDLGLLEPQENRLKLTERGMLVSNEVLQAFV